MKILFISTKGPLPTNDGHCLRTYNLLREAAREHEVYLLSFVKYQEEYQHIAKFQKICSYVEYVSLKENDSILMNQLSLVKSFFSKRPFVALKYDSLHMRSSIRQILHREKIDLIHLDMLPLYCYRDMFSGVPIVLNEHNIESNLLKRRVEVEKGLLHKFFFTKQQRLLEVFEKQALSGVDAVAVCSRQDLLLAKKLVPDINVTIISNGVDVDFFKSSGVALEDEKKLVFVGGLNWHPNREGIEWFDQEILPKIIQHFPEIKVHLVGRPEKIEWQHPSCFVEHGFVDDIRPYLEKSAVFIVPLRVGGGTRLKILDAMSLGRAIVSTTVGAEGLGTINGKHLLLGNSPADFSHAVIRLLEDSGLRRSLSVHARKFVEDNYKWRAIGDKLSALYAQQIDNKKSVVSG